MANSKEENLLAQVSYKSIAGRYASYFHMNPSVTKFSQALFLGVGIENYVKFMDSNAFMANFGRSSLGSNCAICGFTAPKVTDKYDREMYINRTFANPSTVVHEMLHFLTHPLFWGYVEPTIVEAVTEYFTRKVIKSSNSDDFDISQREGRYDEHHTFLTQTRQILKSPPRRGKAVTPPPNNYMKRAYFQGDQTAITFIIEKFSDLQELTALNSST